MVCNKKLVFTYPKTSTKNDDNSFKSLALKKEKTFKIK